MKRCGIYQIRNVINGKVYIGSSMDIDKRWRSHLTDLNKKQHHSKHLQRSFVKHGESSFVFETLELVEQLMLIKTEQKYLDSIRSYDRDIGYNINPTAGSSLGYKMTDQQKLKLRNLNLGIKNPNFGLTRSQDTKEKIGLALIGNKNGIGQRSDDIKKKISVGNKGRIFSMEHKQKLSQAKLGQTKSLSAILKISKPVIRFSETCIKEYPSLTAASKDNNVTPAAIRQACQGNTSQSAGYKWKYKNN